MLETSESVGVTFAPRPAKRFRRLVQWLIFPTILALLLNVGVALLLSCTGSFTDGATTSASEGVGDDSWTVTRYEKRGVSFVTSSLSARSPLSRSWAASQVCGPPDTPNLGDLGTAWASATQDGQVEWLELTYANAVVPSSLKVYESYNPGALVRVIAYRDDGTTIPAWQGPDPILPGGTTVGVSIVPLAVDVPIKRVRIYLDSPKVVGWNEIDAVALVDRQGNTQWVKSCRASSVYGQGTYVAGSPPGDLLPRGLGFTKEPETPGIESAAGFGWPARCLWTPVQKAPPPAPILPVSPYYLTSSSTTILPPSMSGNSSPLVTGSSGSLIVGGGATSTTSTGVVSTGSGTITLTGANTYTGVSSLTAGSPSLGRAALPTRPVMAGLAINTLVYLPPILLLRWLLTVPIRFVREVSRIRRGGCLRCGYDLGYDFVPGCPECGWRREGAR